MWTCAIQKNKINEQDKRKRDLFAGSIQQSIHSTVTPANEHKGYGTQNAVPLEQGEENQCVEHCRQKNRPKYHNAPKHLTHSLLVLHWESRTLSVDSKSFLLVIPSQSGFFLVPQFPAPSLQLFRGLWQFGNEVVLCVEMNFLWCYAFTQFSLAVYNVFGVRYCHIKDGVQDFIYNRETLSLLILLLHLQNSVHLFLETALQI